ncbi:hypothetical protein O6P43_001891 [Quillaja saponaria]|uniref:Uncharacterized protein n=1 Tax=Quillaja saponaria TaxID=32244 RepID=A0AAD7VJN3_QUISA|nr:hypothetical protein O6P43_001891 [Quillaja saponaria]
MKQVDVSCCNIYSFNNLVPLWEKEDWENPRKNLCSGGASSEANSRSFRNLISSQLCFNGVLSLDLSRLTCRDDLCGS